jgi:tRNA A-37 threonylcarbamoyl transferase component Bud32
LCPACALEGAASVATATAGGTRTSPPSIEEIAAHFPELEILELLGAGGMGAVYKARQPQLDRFVALKILSHELARDPSFVERFNREAKMLARLSHPHIVAVFDFGTAGPYCYLLMEYVDGVNLRQAMRTGGFTPAEALALVQDVCSALQFAHEEGILHRDIKPENVLMDSKGRVRIADFGIAKLVGAGVPSDVTLTLQGSILGSPHYMAPEQIETPGDVDQRADIYSLGVVFYEMLTGELPIGRFDLPSEKAQMDRRIDDIVLRTLAKERQARFQSAGEVGTEVAAVAGTPQAGPPTNATADGQTSAARFSLTSAILTGLSLVLAAALALINVSVNASRLPGEGFQIVTGTALFVFGLPAAIAGVIGFLLGIRALGDVRKSGGRKASLGFAIFAVVAWPILLMGVMIQSFMSVPMPGTESIGTSITMLLTGVLFLLAVSILIRGLRRWARGVEKKDGPRHFPGLAGTLLSTLGLAILGPVLAAVVPTIFGPSHDAFERDRMAMGWELLIPESPQGETASHAGNPGRISENTVVPSDYLDQVKWRQGEPEFIIPMTIHSGYEATLRIYAQEGNGNTTHFASLGPFSASHDYDLEHAEIAVGTEVSGNEHQAVVVRSGRLPGLFRCLKDLRDFKFNDSPAEKLTFDSAGGQEVEIATGPGRVLLLEAVVHKEGHAWEREFRASEH